MQGNGSVFKSEPGEYDRLCSEYKLAVPEYFNFGLEIVDAWCKTESRDKMALYCCKEREKEQQISYKQLKLHSDRVANFLVDLGLKKGDKAIVMLPRIPEWWYFTLGMIKAGIVPIPVTARRKASGEIGQVLKISKPEAIVISAGTAWDIDEIIADLEVIRITVKGERDGWIEYDKEIKAIPSVFEPTVLTRSTDPLLVYFTSGTTGPRPRGVVHTHSHALAFSSAASFWYCLGPEDLHWTLSTPGWAKFSWGSFFAPFTVGCTVFVHDCMPRFSPDQALQLIEDHGITSFCATATAYRLLLQEDLTGRDFSRLKKCTTIGEVLDPSDAECWQELTGIELLDGYGQTETTLLIANFPFIEKIPGSLGKPVPSYKIAVVDDEGDELLPYMEGHLAVDISEGFPPGLFAGYLDNPEEDARAFKHGYYYTGDKGYRDDDGYFYFTGRADEIIKTAGFTVVPFEVESVLASHDAVAEAGVTGVPDPIRGQIVKAFVVLSPGYKGSDDLIEELKDHVKQQTAHFKCPRKIVFVDDLPKSKTGKLRRLALRGFKDV
ncbi:MAG: acyl-CoA synthetase [Candidatus Odinarchaeota archaeon]